MAAQGDIAAAAGVVLPCAHITTFVIVRVAFLLRLLLPADLTDADGQEGEEQ